MRMRIQVYVVSFRTYGTREFTRSHNAEGGHKSLSRTAALFHRDHMPIDLERQMFEFRKKFSQHYFNREGKSSCRYVQCGNNVGCPHPD